MKIIKKNNIKDVSEIFDKYDVAVFFGKGPTFKIPEIKNKNEIYICINETVNHIDNCDLLVCNDIETFDKINLIKLKNVKNILVPYHIHVNAESNIDITYIDVIKKIEKYFYGNLIVYNLKTINKKYEEFINLVTCITSIHTGFEFICKFLNIKNNIFHGVCIIGQNNYNDFFVKKNVDLYNNDHILYLKTNLLILSEKYKAQIELN
jgi:hypothetical protein